MANDPYTEIDPFTEVLQALWTLLESSTRFTALVPERNRIKIYEGASKPEKTSYTTADFPMVTIGPVGNQLNMSASSSSATIIQRYRIATIDGDKRPTVKFFLLKWIVFMTLAKIDADLNLYYVKNVSLADVSDNPNTEKHPGWNAEFDVDVEMWFDRSTMKGSI